MASAADFVYDLTMPFQGFVYENSAVLNVADVRLLSANFADLRVWAFNDLTAMHWRWYWHDAPGAWLKCGDRLVEPGPETLVVIPPATPFECGLRAPVGQLFFHFTLPMRRASGRELILQPLKAAQRGEIASLARRIHGKKGGESSANALRWEVMAQVYRALAALPESAWRGQARDLAVERAVSLIYARYPSAPALEELAALVHLSANSLLRRFRAGTGLPPRQFIQQLRIDDACARLHHTDSSIDEIAEATGFTDRYHFSKVFRRVRGLGPAQFRRAVQVSAGANGAG